MEYSNYIFLMGLDSHNYLLSYLQNLYLNFNMNEIFVDPLNILSPFDSFRVKKFTHKGKVSFFYLIFI